MPSVTVIFEPDGRRAEAKTGETLLAVSQRVGLPLRSECGGQGTCGKCRIHVPPDAPLTSPSSSEHNLLSPSELDRGLRLACQARISGGGVIRVFVPPESRTSRRRLQIEGMARTVTLRPAVTQTTIQVSPADPERPTSDDERLLLALLSWVGRAKRRRMAIPLPVLRTLPSCLRAKKGQVTVTLWQGQVVMDVTPGWEAAKRGEVYGVALDLGTSKLAASLHSLATGELLASGGMENPQISHGEDLLSRLSYAFSPDGRGELQRLAVKGVNHLISQLAEEAGVPLGRIYELVVVGNTAMISLFLGVDTSSLARAPFSAPVRGPIDIPAESLGLEIAPQANVHVMPCVAGFVGADAVADILALGLHQASRRRKPVLLVDIGTNSEVILATPDGLAACSCAAGPAFEGAQIKHGMKAVTGAIERVKIDPVTLKIEVATIGNTSPVGLCGSAVVDTVAQLAQAGLITPQGRFTVKAKPHLLGHGRQRHFILVPGDPHHPQITITEQDISQLLLAKAAIQTGIHLLLSQEGVKPSQLKRIYVAGAFGRYLNPASAIRIGLLPPIPPSRVTLVGNTALAGARLALLSTPLRTQAARLAHHIRFLDLARHPHFNNTFTSSLFLPSNTSGS